MAQLQTTTNLVLPAECVVNAAKGSVTFERALEPKKDSPTAKFVRLAPGSTVDTDKIPKERRERLTDSEDLERFPAALVSPRAALPPDPPKTVVHQPKGFGADGGAVAAVDTSPSKRKPAKANKPAKAKKE